MMHTMMPLNRILVFFVIGLVLAPDKASAFSLQAPEVVQFGMPRDSQFVFCRGEDCPERSLKHIALPVLTTPERPSEPLSLPSPAKVEPPMEKRLK